MPLSAFGGSIVRNHWLIFPHRRLYSFAIFTLYEYIVFLNKNEDIDNGIEAATIEEEVMANSNFYVNGSYSSETIYLAIRKLIKEQVPFVEESQKDEM